MEEEKYYREVRTRERIIQVFLFISGFLLAYGKQSVVPFFILFIIFAILYYIYLTRTKNEYFISFMGFMSAYTFSLLLVFFIDTQTGSKLSDNSFFLTFFVFTAIFTFALLSPNTSQWIIDIPEKWSTRFESRINGLVKKYPKLKKVNPNHTKHPKLYKRIIFIIFVILFIILIDIFNGNLWSNLL